MQIDDDEDDPDTAPVPRWHCRVDPTAYATQREADAARCRATPAEWTALRAHYKHSIFELARACVQGSSAEAQGQVVGACGATLFSRFTLPPEGYSISHDVHADVLVCACTNVALKLNYILQRRDTTTVWHALLRETEGRPLPHDTTERANSRISSLERYISAVCSREAVGACEYFVLENMALSLYVETPFSRLERMLGVVKQAWDGLRDEVGRAVGSGAEALGLDDDGLCTRVFGELEVRALQYCVESALSDLCLLHPPSVVALTCMQRAVAAQGVLPMSCVSPEAVLSGAQDKDIAALRAAVVAAHADLRHFFCYIDEVKNGATFFERRTVLARNLRAHMLQHVPNPVKF